MLSGVPFQLHLFKAALIPFPAPENIHYCASSQSPPGGLQATAGAHHPGVPDPFRSQEGLHMPCPTSCCSQAKPKAPTSVHWCALLPSTGSFADKPPITGHSTWHLTNIPALTAVSFHQRWSFEAHYIHLHHISTVRCIAHRTCSLQQLYFHPKRRSCHFPGMALAQWDSQHHLHPLWCYNCFRIASDQDELNSGLVCPRLISL